MSESPEETTHSDLSAPSLALADYVTLAYVGANAFGTDQVTLDSTRLAADVLSGALSHYDFIGAEIYQPEEHENNIDIFADGFASFLFYYGSYGTL